MSQKKAGSGDSGMASLLNGEKIPKDTVYFEAIGTIDELNSLIGHAVSTFNWTEWNSREKNMFNIQPDSDQIKEMIESVQSTLFEIGAHLAAPITKTEATKITNFALNESRVTELEKWIEEMDSQLPKLTQFILPSGRTAIFHLARAVTRRAERQVVTIYEEGDCSQTVLKYLNRLSDFFFVLARFLAIYGLDSQSYWCSQPHTIV